MKIIPALRGISRFLMNIKSIQLKINRFQSKTTPNHSEIFRDHLTFPRFLIKFSIMLNLITLKIDLISFYLSLFLLRFSF